MQLGLVTAVAILIGGFAVTPSYGQASSNTRQYTEPFQSYGQPLCGGEEVTFSGTANFVSHTTVLPDGTSQIEFLRLNYMQTTAVSTSGGTYQMHETDNYGSVQIGANTYRNVINGVLIGQGTLANTGITLVIQTTFNANGQPTANVFVENIRCVG